MDANSALYWLPATRGRMPSPKTTLVPYDHYACLSGLYSGGDTKVLEATSQAVLVAAETMLRETGKQAVFIRGDHTSAKHSGPGAYRFNQGDGIERIRQIVSYGIEDAEGKSWGEWVQESWMVREWLDLESTFGAFGYGPERTPHPIAREWRFFADRDGVVCHQPYWPPEPIEESLDDGDWKAKLTHLNRPLSSTEEAQLGAWATEAARLCPAAKSWSVDFAQDVDGKWWLIDMAVAAASFHYPDCPKRTDPRIVGPRSPKVELASAIQAKGEGR